VRNLSFIQLCRGITLLLAVALAVAHAVGQVPSYWDLAYFLFMMVFVGIPHGGLDHLIASAYSKSDKKPFRLWNFLLVYVLQMAAYGLVWLVLPSFSLLIFLLISAWHFGESDFHPAPRHFLWALAQMTLGTLVLLFILLREPALTADILLRITRGNASLVEVWQQIVSSQTLLYALLMGLLMISVASAQRIEKVVWVPAKWLSFALILLVLRFLPLLPAFALYFGGWHALNTFGHIHSFLPQNDSVFNLWKKSMPLTIMALVMMLITGLVWWYAFRDLDPLPVLFIFIAMITLPHLLVIHRMLGSTKVNPGF
jgi:Brp/Blh family beta-carotene 15,15'-monooxygenase